MLWLHNNSSKRSVKVRKIASLKLACLNTCLNTTFLVSTPADQHLLSRRLNTWLLDAESCLTGEGGAANLEK